MEATPSRPRAVAPSESGSPKAPPGLQGFDEYLEEDGLPISPIDQELDRVGEKGNGPPPSVVAKTQQWLSPQMISVVVTLAGLATVGSMVALLIRIDPQPGQLLATSASASATASAEGSPKEAPSAAPVPTRTRQKQPGPWRIQDAKSDPALRVVTGTIGRESFLKAVEAAGVDRLEAHRILTAMKGVRDLEKCNKRDAFVALVERSSKRVKAFEYVVNKEEIYQAKENAGGLLEGKRLDLAVKREQSSGAFVMDGDLMRSLARANFEPAIRETLAAAITGHMGLDDIERGDAMRIVVQEITVLGEFARYAGIEALEYRPADPKKKPLRIYWFRGEKERGYFDGSGRAPYDGGWRKPIPGAPITSPFNLQRMHPILKKRMPHLGTDLGCTSGVPVGAASFGKVTFKGWNGPTGNFVRIEHAGGIETGYAHLSRFADGLEVGDRVKRLELVGYCGSTGRSTGPHLHFSAKKNGEFFDAMKLNLDAMRLISSGERPTFDEARRKYDLLLDQLPLPELPAAAHAPPPAPSASETPGGEEDDGEDSVNGSSSVTAPPPSSSAAPSAPHENNAVYMTDKELMEQQKHSDDGEVEE